MGYHTEAELPVYWAYARNFVLQDHMFEAIRSWSLPAHLYMVSEWAASCARIDDPMSCTPESPTSSRSINRAISPVNRRRKNRGARATRGPT